MQKPMQKLRKTLYIIWVVLTFLATFIFMREAIGLFLQEFNIISGFNSIIDILIKPLL